MAQRSAPITNIVRRLPCELPWTPPNRHNGLQELPSIPVELYTLIFDHIDPHDPCEMTMLEHKSTTAALCLVCRMFCVECQPRLFRVVQHSGTADSARHGRALQLWSNLLKEKDQRSILLANFVQEYTLSSWYASNASAQWFFTAFLERRMATALHFMNLKTFKMKNCQIFSSTLGVLAQMPSLRSVSFDGCIPTIQGRLEDTQHSHTAWTRFSATQTFFPSEWHQLLSDFIDADGLEYLSVDDWSLACAILEGRHANRLRELYISIGSSQASSVPTFLARMPNLTRLSVYDGPWGLGMPLSPHVIPRLQEIEGGSTTLSQIIPGRPIAHIALSGSRGVPQTSIFSAAKHSTANIRSMCLPQAHLHLLRSADFPYLESLTIRPKCVRRMKSLPYLETFHGALARESPVLSLRSITYALDPTCCWVCATWLLDLNTQHVTLSDKVPPIFPNVQQFRMADIIEWRRDPGQAWVPHVLSRPAARELLFRRDVRDISDVDGCLRSLLRDDELTADDRSRLGDHFKVHTGAG